MCGFHFEWQKTMVEMLRSYLLTDNLENPLEYAVPTLSQKRRETIPLSPNCTSISIHSHNQK